ncbi:MAG: ATPase, T2SS/T4P/T4SS family, partial [bacterium]
MANRAAAAGAWRAAAAGMPVWAPVEERRLVADALLRGRPVAWSDPESEATEEYTGLAAALDAVPGPTAHSAAPDADAAFRGEAYAGLKRRLHRRLLDAWRDRGGGGAAAGAGFAPPGREAVQADLRALLEAEETADLTPGFRERLLNEVAAGVVGLGPLEDLVADPEITEIMVNGPGVVYVERGGRLFRSERALEGEEELRGLIERIVAPLGRRIDEASPLVDARLPDGSRVNAIIPPLALNGPCLTIRKFPRRRLTADDLLAQGSLTPAARTFVEAAVAGRLNILISGGTGSGKTTLLNIVAAFIGPDERIVTIEDAAELRLPQAHVVSLEARPPNLEGQGAVTIRDLVRNALRMRP